MKFALFTFFDNSWVLVQIILYTELYVSPHCLQIY